MESNSHRAGRPRDSRLDETLLKAALEVFLERGYQRASLSEIARRAGVGTPAIYRRWKSKPELAIAVFVREAEPDPIPDTRSIRRDLAAFLRGRIRMFNTRIFHRLLIPVVAEASLDPRLSGEIRQRFVAYRQPTLDARIRKAIKAGQLRRDTEPSRLLNLLLGTVTMPLLFSQDQPKQSQAQDIVDQVLEGFARPR